MAVCLTVHLCTGSDCRGKKKAQRKLAELLEGCPVEVHAVRCQKVCRGPVVGVEVDGTLEWFQRVDDDKRRSALRALLERGKLKKALAKRRARKRRDKLRK